MLSARKNTQYHTQLIIKTCCGQQTYNTGRTQGVCSTWTLFSTFCVWVSVSECPLRVSVLQLLGSSCSDLLKTLDPTSAAHRPRGGETYSSSARKQGTETDSNRKTKNDRAEAAPHAAALVLKGTQPGSIAQAPNSSNMCSHADCRVGVKVGDCCSINPTTLHPLLRGWTSLTGPQWLASGHWAPGRGLRSDSQWHQKLLYRPSWSDTGW